MNWWPSAAPVRGEGREHCHRRRSEYTGRSWPACGRVLGAVNIRFGGKGTVRAPVSPMPVMGSRHILLVYRPLTGEAIHCPRDRSQDGKTQTAGAKTEEKPESRRCGKRMPCQLAGG